MGLRLNKLISEVTQQRVATRMLLNSTSVLEGGIVDGFLTLHKIKLKSKKI